MASRNLSKEDIQKRIKSKQKIRKKKKIKSWFNKTIFRISVLTNIYFLSMPYHDEILTNISDTYNKALPIVEALINKLPL